MKKNVVSFLLTLVIAISMATVIGAQTLDTAASVHEHSDNCDEQVGIAPMLFKCPICGYNTMIKVTEVYDRKDEYGNWYPAEMEYYVCMLCDR